MEPFGNNNFKINDMKTMTFIVSIGFILLLSSCKNENNRNDVTDDRIITDSLFQAEEPIGDDTMDGTIRMDSIPQEVDSLQNSY